jgi:predicted transcriptional regulator
MDIVDKIILKLIDSGEPHVTCAAASQLGLSRQAVSARIRRMEGEQLLSAHGRGEGVATHCCLYCRCVNHTNEKGLTSFMYGERASPRC